jgi:hypothetical protein
MSRTSSSGDHRPLALPTPAGRSSRRGGRGGSCPSRSWREGSCFQEFCRRTPAATTSTETPTDRAASSAAKVHGPGTSRGCDAAALDGRDDQRVSVTMRPSPFPRVEPSPSAAWRAPSCAVVRRFRTAPGTPWRRPQPRQVPPRVHRCRRPLYRGRGGRGHRPLDRRPLPTCECPPSRMSSCDSVWRAYTAAREAPSLSPDPPPGHRCDGGSGLSGPAFVRDGGLTSSDLTSGLSDGAGPSAPLVALSPERPYARSSSR